MFTCLMNCIQSLGINTQLGSLAPYDGDGTLNGD